jgi:predicted ATP-grasp superfamily ATP-dependent carboligase
MSSAALACASGSLPPALIVGGLANALSVARSLGRRGIDVYALSPVSKQLQRSRYVRWIPFAGDGGCAADWERFLLGAESEFLRGAVLLLCCDVGLEIAARHHARLAEKFRIEEANPAVRALLLDKLATYRAAAAAGFPTPRFWEIKGEDELDAIEKELVFPLLVKPRMTHHFERIFRRKFLRAESLAELREQFRAVAEQRIEVVLLEFIPGPDSQLCSYYSYLDERGEPLFHFTKRVLRRYPPNMGGATYHITDWNPEVAEQGLALFRAVGLRGLGNVEFKRDLRDGVLKLIECNARFTAGNPLVASSGIDLGSFVYDPLAGLPPKAIGDYARGLRLWSPWDDFLAYQELRARGELSFTGWLRSLMHRQVLPLFAWDDPLPSLATLRAQLVRLFERHVLGRRASA